MKEKILCVTHKYPPVIGGMERQSYELIKRLGDYFDTHVIAYKNEGSKLSWFLALKKSIEKELDQHPDIKLVHLNDGLLGSACLWLQKRKDNKTVITIHGLDITFPLETFQNRIVPQLAQYDATICVSEATRQACLDRGFDPGSTYTVLNGVDHDMQYPPLDKAFAKSFKQKHGLEDKKVLVTMGRAVTRKGFSWFITEVMPKLQRDVVLLMIGPLPESPSLAERAVLNLPGSLGHNLQLMLGVAADAPAVRTAISGNASVIHLGKLDFADLKQVLSLSDIFIMPNVKVRGDAEGFGLVALEAAMRGTPVLASGIEGITDAVHDGKNGFLIPSGNAAEWVAKIEELLGPQWDLNAFSQEVTGYTIQHYSWEKMVQGYVEVFKKTLRHEEGQAT